MFRIVGRPLFSACLALAAAAPLSAQIAGPVPEIAIGTRVRVFAPDIRSDRYVGRVDSLDAAIVVLDTAGARTRLGFDTGPVLVDSYRRVAIRLNAIQRIEVSGGRTVVGATVRGGVLGGLIGGVLYGLGNLPEVNPTAADFVKNFPRGALTGLVVGGAIGWMLGGERWIPARLPR